MGADDSTWGIAAQRWEELRKFRATHQPKHITVKGVNWNYIVSGEGGETSCSCRRSTQHELVSRLSKEDLRGMGRLGIDLVESFRFAPDELASWPGRVLILESDEDIVTPEQRAELRRRYLQARVHTFHGAGHTPWMSHKEEYLSVINEFLDQE